MGDRDQATSRGGVYRRRLAAAAVASLALHLILARGLALTSLGLDGPRPASEAARSAAKPARDFPIRVSKSPARRPAHEQPLAIAAPRPAADRPAPRAPVDAAVGRLATAPAESALLPAPSPAPTPEPIRDASLSAAAAPARAAAAASGPMEEAAVADATPIGRADAAAAPAAPERSRANPAAVASRWRPREVALLERLTAPVAARPQVARDGLDTPLPDTSTAARAAADAAAADAPAADAIVAPGGDLDPRVAVEPAERAAARDGIRAATGPRGTTAPGDRLAPQPAAVGTAADPAAARARREAATGAAGGSRPAGRRTGAVSPPVATADALAAGGAATSDDAGSATATPARVGGSPRRSGGGVAAGAAARRVGTADDGAAGGDSTTSPGSALASLASRPSRGESPATDAPAPARPGRAAAATDLATDATATVPGATGATPGDGTAVEWVASRAAGPRSVGRAGGVVGRPAPAVDRTTAGADAADESDVDDAQLSVPAVVAGSAARGSDDDAAPASLRPLGRVTVVALPAESRVRDVAEAFARRGRDARPDRRADPRAARADAVVDRGLDFLAKAQQPDGRWSLGRFAGSGPADVPELTSDTAATGLALLAFLGAGHDHFDGPHRDTVRRGLEFLLAVQKPDGDLYLPADDLSNSCAWLYSHGIASIALCEAVGMTGDPLVKPGAAKACGFIAASRHPERGGWRYLPRSDADLSVSGWMLVALRSGDLAGVETDPRALAGVRTLLDAAAAADDPARYAYNPRKPDQRSSELSNLCMTAVGALMRLHTGAKPDDPRVTAAARVLAARRPAYDVRGRDSYLWYYASQVLVHTGGPEWDAWYAALVDTLAANQETAGATGGSWNPLGPRPDRWGRYGGRIYVTALHLLALEVPDRRLPTYTAGE